MICGTEKIKLVNRASTCTRRKKNEKARGGGRGAPRCRRASPTKQKGRKSGDGREGRGVKEKEHNRLYHQNRKDFFRILCRPKRTNGGEVVVLPLLCVNKMATRRIHRARARNGIARHLVFSACSRTRMHTNNVDCISFISQPAPLGIALTSY